MIERQHAMSERPCRAYLFRPNKGHGGKRRGIQVHRVIYVSRDTLDTCPISCVIKYTPSKLNLSDDPAIIVSSDTLEQE